MLLFTATRPHIVTVKCCYLLLQVSDSMMCCVWAVRAVAFSMQRAKSGRVLLVGDATADATRGRRMEGSYSRSEHQLAMHALGHSIREELSDSKVAVRPLAVICCPLPSLAFTHDAKRDEVAAAWMWGFVGRLRRIGVAVVWTWRALERAERQGCVSAEAPHMRCAHICISHTTQQLITWCHLHVPRPLAGLRRRSAVGHGSGE
jgi:hypothetical protein